jgi:acyl CoA:acetate/3-ketoacid CoA transferase alpha subunit
MSALASGKGNLFQMEKVDEVRYWNRDKKKKGLVDKVMTEQQAVSQFVTEGCYLGVELYGSVRCPMSLVREVVRQGPQHLRLAGQGVLENDLIIAADLVDKLDITYHGYEVYGISPVLRRACESGRIETVEWSNAALAWRFKAAGMGLPFLPVRSMLGTDTFNYSAAKEIECPFTGQKLCALPALTLDVGMLHVHRCDRFGNAQIDGISGFGMEMARASKRLIISTEEIVEHEEIARYPERTVIPYYIVDAVVEAPGGSLPGEMPYVYWRDEEHMDLYFEKAKNVEGVDEYIAEWVKGTKNHAEFIEKLGGQQKMAKLREQATRR